MRDSKVYSLSSLKARQLGVLFVLLFLVNALVIHFANGLFPGSVVLGTFFFSRPMAIIYSMKIFTIIMVEARLLVEYIVEKKKAKLSTQNWQIVNYLINFVSLWTVARLADILGMGLSSWRVVAILALVFYLAQVRVLKRITKD